MSSHLILRYAPSPPGYNSSLRSAQENAYAARQAVDVDEPTIEDLQTLLILSMAFYSLGKGKKAYMALGNITTMASQNVY